MNPSCYLPFCNGNLFILLQHDLCIYSCLVIYYFFNICLCLCMSTDLSSCQIYMSSMTLLFYVIYFSSACFLRTISYFLISIRLIILLQQISDLYSFIMNSLINYHSTMVIYLNFFYMISVLYLPVILLILI